MGFLRPVVSFFAEFASYSCGQQESPITLPEGIAELPGWAMTGVRWKLGRSLDERLAAPQLVGELAALQVV